MARPLRLAAEAWPFTRRISIALSMSPCASARAALQSMIPAPVRSRSSLTSRRLDVPAVGAHELASWPVSAGAASLLCCRGGGLGCLLGLLLGALLGLAALALLFLAPPALGLLGLALGLRLAVGLRGLVDGLADRADHEVARADRVVVAGHGVRGRHGIDVGVDQPDDRDPQALGFAHRDLLGLEVDDQRGLRQPLHVPHATEVVLELRELGLARHPLLGGKQIQLPRVLELRQLVQAVDAGRHRVEVGEQAAQPALVDVRHAAPLRPLLDRVARLLLRPDEQDRATLARHVGRETARLGEQMLGLQQVDDVDPVALAVDVRPHRGIPAPRLVAEVKAGLQQLLDSGFGHEAPLLGFACVPTALRGPGVLSACRAGPRAFRRGSVTGRRGL